MRHLTLTATVVLATAMAGPALANEELRSFANDLFDPIPLSTPEIEGNIISRPRVELGAMLFFDPRMSRSGLFSCQSCHNVGLGGVDGLTTSIGQGCAACHAGVNMGGQDYYPFGLVERPGGTVLPEGDRGRFTVTETASDDYVFRAAPLRNIELTAPYFHSGVVWSLEEAVAVMGVSQLGADLSEQEVDDIVAFLRRLTGEILEVVHPTLPPSTDSTPRPEPM